ncbi:MAG: DUF4394 domain-containing protein [Verrucomicrobia bacterium]|nr:DUF4394 domain-containing protein [Verrucomicrobiota bacterium]
MKLSTFAFCALGASFLSFSAQAETGYALSPTGLYQFDSASPSASTFLGSFSGLGSGQSIVGIDVRPFNGQLYAFGFNPSTLLMQVYTVNLSGPVPTGGPSVGLTPVGSGFTLTGTDPNAQFGIDFNPTVDRIRIMTSTGTNYRANPITGGLAATDTALAYASGDPNAGTAPQVVGAAYTNNFNGGGTTTLYGYDFTNDALVTVGGLNGSPTPNGGQVFTIANITLGGASGFAEDRGIGFDISGVTGAAYLFGSFSFDGGVQSNSLYTVNLGTGALTSLGSFGFAVRDVAFIPEPSTYALCATGLAGLLALRRRRKA